MSKRPWITGLLLFGLAFGYVEAAVVVYLRALSAPVRQRLLPEAPADALFPVISWERLQTEAPDTARLIPAELVRELATIVMLAAVAWLVRGRGSWLPAFAIVFGAWDASFYLFLKVLIGWPESLLTWDILFLLPVPWTAPVLAPLLVSAALIGCGIAGLMRRVHFQRLHWVICAIGNAVILASFTLDYRSILAGAVPEQFPWILFLSGWALAVTAFVAAYRSGVLRPVESRDRAPAI